MSTLQIKSISNTNGTEGIRIFDDGKVKFTSRPKFSARGCSNTTAGGRTILFDQVIDYNVGSHYNSGNGRFTAPITGVYMINFTLFFSGASRMLSTIQLNGGSIQEYTQEQPTAGTGQGYATCRGSLIFNLTASDYVSIYATGTVIGTGVIYSTFNCCLVS